MKSLSILLVCTVAVVAAFGSQPESSDPDSDLQSRIERIEKHLAQTRKALRIASPEGGSFFVNTTAKRKSITLQSSTKAGGSLVQIAFDSNGRPEILCFDSSNGKTYRAKLTDLLALSPASLDVTEEMNSARDIAERQVKSMMSPPEPRPFDTKESDSPPAESQDASPGQ